MPSENGTSKGWNIKRWTTIDLAEADPDLEGLHFDVLDPISCTPRELQTLFAAFQSSEEKDDADTLPLLFPRIVRRHNFIGEDGVAIAQFNENPDAANDIPMLVIRFIVNKFQELASPDREVFPKRSASVS
jgi:hypothetical protein